MQKKKRKRMQGNHAFPEIKENFDLKNHFLKQPIKSQENKLKLK